MKKLIIILFVFYTLCCYSEDLWKPSIGIISPASIYNIAVSDDNVIFAASEQNLFRSDDGGNSWDPIYLEFQNLNEHFFSGGVLKCDKNGDLYILTREALYKLPKNENIAKQILNFEYSTSNNFSIFLGENSKKVVVYDGNEIWVSNDFGTTWKQINLGKIENYNLSLTSISYDENFGIIKNYVSDNFKKEFYIYYSTDDGLIWRQLKTLPGTNIPAKDIHVFDANLWVVGSDVFNLNTKKLSNTYIDNAQEYLKNSKGYYITTYSEIFFSGDEGVTWKDITNDVFKGDALGWIDAFYTGNTDVLYAGTRYKKLKKSIDNGNIWERIILNTSTDMQFSGVKKAGKNVYATDNTNSIFISEDSCKTWKQIPLYKDYYYTDKFDVNNKGEMVYNDGPVIYYSQDMGSIWKMLDTTNVNRTPSSQLKIFDNGIIIGSTGSSSFMYSNQSQRAKWLNTNIGNLIMINDSIYLNGLQILDKDFNLIGGIGGSISKILGYMPEIKNICVSNSGAIYVSTDRGIFKTPDLSDNFNLVAFKDSIMNQIFVDDNNYIYISIGQRILYSKDEGKNWIQINSNLGFTTFQFFFAFGDARLLVRSDKVYYGDLKNAIIPVVLNLKVEAKDYNITYNSPSEVNYLVSDDSGNSIESAAIVIFNSLTCKIDTLYSDVNGKATLNLKIDYYNQNQERVIRLFSYVSKKVIYKVI